VDVVGDYITGNMKSRPPLGPRRSSGTRRCEIQACAVCFTVHKRYHDLVPRGDARDCLPQASSLQPWTPCRFECREV